MASGPDRLLYVLRKRARPARPGDGSLHFIEDVSAVASIDAAVSTSSRDVCKEVLDTLTPREAKVLRLRFGIEMNTDHTLASRASQKQMLGSD